MRRRIRFTLHNFSIWKVTRIQGVYRTAVLCAFCLLSIPAGAEICKQWKEAVRIGELPVQLKEASGLAASRQFPGRVYHINDSGDIGRFYFTDMEGKNGQAVRVAGFAPYDTEAISLGACPNNRQRSCIYIADIGDNDQNRKSVEVVVVEEAEKFAQPVKPVKRFRLHYPDGQPHDAESFAVHPDGTMYLLTKTRPGRLYKANTNKLEQTLMPVIILNLGNAATDMTISDDGTRMLILTYRDAFEYSMDFKEQNKIHLNFLQQQEGVAYLPGSRAFIYTTEQLLPVLPQWMMKVECVESH
jgi:hypothetical protein